MANVQNIDKIMINSTYFQSNYYHFRKRANTFLQVVGFWSAWNTYRNLNVGIIVINLLNWVILKMFNLRSSDMPSAYTTA